jgi:pimeloyl-ACP methyl ester carboxylesterase
VPTKLGDTFLISSGSTADPALILLHGAASNATSWVGDVEIYARRFRVHAVDIPGEPGRSAETRATWHDESYAIWLADVLDALGLESAAFVGISQGGWMALRFGVTFPNRVTSMALFAPGGIVCTKGSFIRRAMIFSLFGSAGRRSIARYVTRTADLPSEAIRINDSIMTHFIPRIEKEYLFSDEELSRLTMPVLLTCGADDVVFPTDPLVERMRRLVRTMEGSTIERSGHGLVNRASETLPFLIRYAS